MHTMLANDERLLNLLGALSVALADRIATATEEAVGESATAVAALVSAAQFPGTSIEELRHTLGLSHSAAVRVVDRLAARGLVERRPGPKGPAVAVVATAAGERLATRVLDIRRDVVREVARDAPTGDLDSALSAMLARLTVDPEAGDRACRLCDVGACPSDRCPVAERQRVLGAVVPDAVALPTQGNG
jgi:MarR family transcriptional regulator, negative regulator of the multidrug operon emrRAB